jgi:hypothetical protein
VNYEWICKACGQKNAPHIEACSSCACHASASASEIEKLQNHEGKKKKQIKDGYIKKLASLMYTPFFAIVYGVSGRVEALMLAAIVLVVSLKINENFIKFVTQDTWLRKTLIILSAILSLLIVTRLLIDDDSVAINWLLAGFVGFSFGAYYLLFNSKSGQAALARYSKHIEGQ